MMNSFWRDRPTLVTGASGFLGSSIVRRLLAEGAAVVCLVRDWVPESDLVRDGMLTRAAMVRGDICDQALAERVIGEHEVVSVFHLAAQTVVRVANANPVSTFASNIAGTWSVLEACRRSPRVTEIVVASSDKAYGDAAELPYDETNPLAGRHPYDVSKSCADLIAQAYATTYRLPVTISRCGNLFGPGDLNWNRLVPGTIRSVLNGQAPVIRSNGTYVRDYLYVEDAVESYLRLAESLAANSSLLGQAFNFSNETRLTAIDVVRMILTLMGSDLEPEVRNEVSQEIVEQTLSAAKARTILRWTPAFSIEEGLKRTIDWYTVFLEGQQSWRERMLAGSARQGR